MCFSTIKWAYFGILWKKKKRFTLLQVFWVQWPLCLVWNKIIIEICSLKLIKNISRAERRKKFFKIWKESSKLCILTYVLQYSLKFTKCLILKFFQIFPNLPYTHIRTYAKSVLQIWTFWLNLKGSYAKNKLKKWVKLTNKLHFRHYEGEQMIWKFKTPTNISMAPTKSVYQISTFLLNLTNGWWGRHINKTRFGVPEDQKDHF